MNVQLIYANGATINLSQADIQLSFSVNGRPIIITALALPIAKQLQNALNQALSEYERKTNTKIPEAKEISELLRKP